MLDFFSALAQATTLEDVWETHCRAMEALGFDRLIYGYTQFAQLDSLGDPQDALFLSNHPAAYFDRFIGERMFLHAPLMRWARENVGACSWGALWDAPAALSQAERDVIAFNRSMGVTAGYTIRFADPSPRTYGAISLAARAGLSQPEVDALWAERGQEIEAMNLVAHLKIISLPYKTERAALSPRQREVLGWIGEGKSNQDIATILGVSLPTVEKHLRLAREKLGAETTAQAVLKASFRKQIHILHGAG